MIKKIQLHAPHFGKDEIDYLSNCIKSGWVTTKGKYVDEFQNKIKSLTKSKFVLPTINATSALHISLLLSHVKRGEK